jgi:hypothetical protein
MGAVSFWICRHKRNNETCKFPFIAYLNKEECCTRLATCISMLLGNLRADIHKPTGILQPCQDTCIWQSTWQFICACSTGSKGSGEIVWMWNAYVKGKGVLLPLANAAIRDRPRSAKADCKTGAGDVKAWGIFSAIALLGHVRTRCLGDRYREMR